MYSMCYVLLSASKNDDTLSATLAGVISYHCPSRPNVFKFRKNPIAVQKKILKRVLRIRLNNVHRSHKLDMTYEASKLSVFGDF